MKNKICLHTKLDTHDMCKNCDGKKTGCKEYWATWDHWDPVFDALADSFYHMKNVDIIEKGNIIGRVEYHTVPAIYHDHDTVVVFNNNGDMCFFNAMNYTSYLHYATEIVLSSLDF